MNKAFMMILRLGLPKGGKDRPVVLTVAGRRPGQPRSTPITPFTLGGECYVVAGFPGALAIRCVDQTMTRDGVQQP